jgi:hypothetical protein
MKPSKLISYGRFYDLYALMGFVSFFVVVIFGIRPAFVAWRSNLSLLEDLEAESSRLDSSLELLERRGALDEQVAPYLGTLNEVIKTGFSGGDVSVFLLTKAARHGFLLNNVSFPKPEIEAGKASSSISFTVEGRASNFIPFLESLEESDVSMVIESFRLGFSDRTSDESVNVKATMYYLVEGEEPGEES